MTLWIFTQQKASLPSWAPLRRRRLRPPHGRLQQRAGGHARARARRSMIAGIQVGKITSVDLEDGHAVVGMDIEPKYLELIHPDATLLLRPKTNLNDMVVEIDPGQRAGARRRRRTTSRSPRPNRTSTSKPSSRPSTPTPASTCSCCVAGGAAGDRRPRPPALRRLPPPPALLPLHRRPQPRRRRSAASRWPGVIHDFGLLTTELGRHDAEIERFVTSSKAALGNFANQQQAIQESLVEFPATLTRAAGRRWPAPTASRPPPARRCSA